MNERIKELAEQATLYANDIQDADAYADWYEVRDTKFAELVRQDEREACAKVCDEQEERYLQMYRGVGDFAKSTVKGSQWADGLCDAASECAEIIRARSKHDTNK